MPHWTECEAWIEDKRLCHSAPLLTPIQFNNRKSLICTNSPFSACGQRALTMEHIVRRVHANWFICSFGCLPPHNHIIEFLTMQTSVNKNNTQNWKKQKRTECELKRVLSKNKHSPETAKNRSTCNPICRVCTHSLAAQLYLPFAVYTRFKSNHKSRCTSKITMLNKPEITQQ